MSEPKLVICPYHGSKESSWLCQLRNKDSIDMGSYCIGTDGDRYYKCPYWEEKHGKHSDDAFVYGCTITVILAIIVIIFLIKC